MGEVRVQFDKMTHARLKLFGEAKDLTLSEAACELVKESLDRHGISSRIT